MNNEMAKSVDIIIPIYNAFEDLQICIESIKRNTNLEKHRVILVNDNSPDERIRPYLEDLREEGFLVHHNEINKGFSANINIGMKQSEENDVILLNSDTVVTSDWVEKILVCAYSDRAIGTVTPLSNNATLCSVPKFCEENRLPEYLTIDQAADIVEDCSFCDYPRITVAHGFCMFVKREVINKIGGFDSETFQRGYGEENDFCNRAQQVGYVHAMCDNTYIYHSGTKSFISKEKEKLIRSHEQILEERYPVQMHNNAVYCRDNPNKYICDNVGLFFELRNGKKNILYILHSDFKAGKRDNIGGTQFHVRDLKNGLCYEHNIYVLARNLEYLCLTAYIEDREYSFNFYVGEPDAFLLDTNQKIENVLNNILEAFKIDLIHVHHVINLSFDIFYLAKEKNIPVLLTAHDFYYICPTIKLLSKAGEPCCESDSEKCRKCLRGKVGVIGTVSYLKFWRERVRTILDICTGIIFPSESARYIYEQTYPEFREKYRVIEHGVEKVFGQNESPLVVEKEREEFLFGIDGMEKAGMNQKIKGWINAFQIDRDRESFYLVIKGAVKDAVFLPVTLSGIDYRKGIVARFEAVIPEYEKEFEVSVVIFDGREYYRSASQAKPITLSETGKNYKLRVAFIGGLDVSKGSRVVKEIISKGSNDVHWFTFGTIGDFELHDIKKDNYTEIGTYSPRDLPTLIRQHDIDLIGILSIWPETYSYTLSEAIVNEKPVIVTDIGALGERMNRYQCGYVVPLENAAREFIDCVDKIKEDKNLYLDLKRKIASTEIRTISEMLQDYRELYNGIMREWTERIYKEDYDKKLVFQSIEGKAYDKPDAVVPGTNPNIEFWMREAKEYEILKTTLTYQFMVKIINMRLPFKKQLMDFIYKLRRRTN